MNIGVLSLQGNYFEHLKKIELLEFKSIKVKTKNDLFKCDGLIIPGGESTTMSKLLDYQDLRRSILEIKDKIHIMGVCAGMVLLSKTTKYNNLKTLSIMDFKVERNGWGRQINSFNKKIKLSFSAKKIMGTFIRAPKIISYNDRIECLAMIDNEPILLTDGRHLACSFHPEYSDNLSIYKYFLNLINSK